MLERTKFIVYSYYKLNKCSYFSVSNKLTYYTENPLKDKKPMIVLISLVVAVLILVITSFVLFKVSRIESGEGL